MEIHSKCKNCAEPTKYISGCWDGIRGTHGHMYDCKNEKCEVKILSSLAEDEVIQKRLEIQNINSKNEVYVLALATKRKDKKLTMRKMAAYIGITAPQYCDYEQERTAMPKVLYDKALEYIDLN